MNVVTTLNMSHYIASDVPLSPISSDWDQSQYSPTGLDFSSLHYNYALPSSSQSVGSTSSGSPIPASKVLRGRMSPDNSETEPQLCLPTHQLFDMSYAPSPEVLSSPPSEPDPLPPATPTPSESVVPCKRASSAAPSVSKKPRAVVTTKDFIPPDVTGLSKREARLVKNRAAAFLSRQRKREEFENMELRVAELEQENARLLAIAESKQVDSPQELLSEVEQLRAQLAAAEARERALNDELTRQSVPPATTVKIEEPQMQLIPRAPSTQAIHKSGASLGLMVLLCALPTLLSLPTQSTVPTTFSLPLSNAISSTSSAFDMQSFMPGDFDWMTSGGSIMDLDIDGQGRISTTSAGAMSNAKKLEFVDADSEALGLSGLDISFDATPSENGKIRVRIHPPASSTTVSSASSPEPHSDSDDQSMWGGSDFGGAPSPAAGGDMDSLGPFLADYAQPHMSVDSASDLVSPAASTFSPFISSEQSFDFGFGDYPSSNTFGAPSASSASGRRRVRIALKSMPGSGREGGEWEVQLC